MHDNVREWCHEFNSRFGVKVDLAGSWAAPGSSFGTAARPTADGSTPAIGMPPWPKSGRLPISNELCRAAGPNPKPADEYSDSARTDCVRQT